MQVVKEPREPRDTVTQGTIGAYSVNVLERCAVGRVTSAQDVVADSAEANLLIILR